MLRFLSSFFCLLFTLGLFANNDPSQYSALMIPEELKKNAHTVIRDFQQTFEIKSLSQGILKKKYVVTLLSQESSEDVMVINYDKDSQIVQFQATLYDAFGNVLRKSDKQDFKDYSAVSDFSIYEDDRVRVLTMTHSHYPFTIEFETQQILKGSMFFTYPEYHIQAYGESVEKSSFEVLSPKNVKVHHRAFNTDITPTEREIKNKKSIKWQVKNLPAVEKESMSPGYMEVLPVIVTAPDQFIFEDYTGSMRNWEEYGKFIYKLGVGRDNISKELAEEIKKLTTGLTTNEDKIKVLYKYMQSNMRYVSVQLGIGGLQPFSASYVEKHKYGDCKALSNFMKSMLKEVGIKSYPVIIRRGGTPPDYPEDFVLPYFNHVLLYAPEEDIWMECTSTDYPVNYLGSSNADRKVILVTEEGGKMAKTPKLKAIDNYKMYEVAIKLDDTGSADIQAEIEYGGSPHEYQRSVHKRTSPEEKEKIWLKNTSIPSPNSLKIEYSSEDNEPIARTKYSVQSAQYSSKAANRLFVPANRISAFKSIVKRDKYRKLPLVRKTGYSETSNITFTLPEAYDIEALPAAKTLENEDFGSYSISFEKQEDGTVLLKRSLEIKAFSVGPERLDDLRNFYKEISKADNQQFVLVREQRP